MVSYEGSVSTAMTKSSQPADGCVETSVGCPHGSSTSSVSCCGDDAGDDSLKIAWRYKNLHLPVEFSFTFLL